MKKKINSIDVTEESSPTEPRNWLEAVLKRSKHRKISIEDSHYQGTIDQRTPGMIGIVTKYLIVG